MTCIGVVAAAAGGVEQLRLRLVEPLLAQGHQVAVTLTPTAAAWLDAVGERPLLQARTGLPVRSSSRLPGEPKPHPPVDVFVAAPLTANSTAKLALGIADNQALTVLCEAVATTPMVVCPAVNGAHARHPAWSAHLDALRSVGVVVVGGYRLGPATGAVADPPGIAWDAVLAAVRLRC